MSIRGLVVLSSTCCRLVQPSTIFPNLLNSVLKLNSLPYRCTFSRYNQIRYISKKNVGKDPPTQTTDDAGNATKRMRAKTTEVAKITLLDEKNNISVCTMEEAEKIAKSKKLRLVQVVDPKLRTQRRTFRMMSENEYLEEELNDKQRIKEEKKKKDLFTKGEKIVTISPRSSAHDVEVKVKKALKMLEKKFLIRVIILGSANTATPQEESYKQFEKAFKDVGRIVQKRMKDGILRFQIIPPKKEDTESEGNEVPEGEKSNSTENEDVNDDKFEAVKKSA